MLVGYARTSTVEQDAGLEAQQRDLKALGCEKVFAEQVSSVARREALQQALEFVREDDTLVVTKLDRLARSTTDLLALVGRLEARKVGLRVLSMGNGAEPLDTTTATGKLMLTVLAAVAEFERGLMLERQREGIAKAKSDGKYRGRAPTARRQAAEVHRLKSEGVKPTDIAKRLGLGRASVYRVLAETVA